MNNTANNYDSVRKLERTSSIDSIESEILSTATVNIDVLRKEGVFIFGVGSLGRRINEFFTRNNIPIRGHADNNNGFHRKQLNGSVIFSPAVLSTSSIVFIASETYSHAIQQQLNSLGIHRTLTHFQAGILFKSFSDYPIDNFYSGLAQDLFVNKENYLKTFSSLKDEKSKIVFDHLIGYRLTANPEHIQLIASAGQLEYFDPSVMTLGTSEVFIDCGGFDGDSALNFINYSGSHYKSIHIFEPDRQLLVKARERLKGFERIHYNEKGIFNKTATLFFNSTGGLDGSINTVGNIKIDTVSIDEYDLEDIPTYIKLDIEGAEIQAIDGALKTIKSYSPKLAVAGYHFPKHLWEIPLHVMEINPRYDLVLRHYSNAFFGSTYYFLPR